ncbi:MAG: 50S ribosomal protein L3 N(5)-glutamine methyltransferase [Succinivibrionaceae bacterium]|nr:50S ribosomal protein L3 N(5)-glutamine methyltransferase [Succinivibrionaceae bacterium]
MDNITSDYNFVSAEVIQTEIFQELSTVADLQRYLASAICQSGVYCGHGSDGPMQEAIQLLSFALGIDYDEVDNFPTAVVTVRERHVIYELLRQRIFERIPTPYITNVAYYSGLRFYVDQRVLIPRSPIAELIENGLSGMLAEDASLALDLCTGSGCLAILMAEKLDLEVDAVDISDDALEVCAYNVDMYGMQDQVFPIKSDLFASLDKGIKYDIIVANPPYVDEEDMNSVPEEFLCEPQMALAAGVDGLDVVRRILREAGAYLKPDAWLICEVGNSMDALIDAYPGVDFHWLPLVNGGFGVFAISRRELEKFARAR